MHGEYQTSDIIITVIYKPRSVLRCFVVTFSHSLWDPNANGFSILLITMKSYLYNDNICNNENVYNKS